MSVPLLESSSVPADLSAKYQKLASEYAKIRAQFGVLKKAVVDEQNQTTELKEILRTKDQNLRKAEQELHSLNFRNQQLTKRVTILQDELDSIQGTTKSKFKGNSKDKKDSIIVEELQNKISENALLFTSLQEQSEKHENERFKLNQQIEYQEHKIKEYESALAAKESVNLVKCKEDMKLLQSRLATKDEETRRLQNEIKQLKIDLLGKNATLKSAEVQDNYIKLVQNLSLNKLLMLLSQFFQQIECRYGKNMEEPEFKVLEEINQKNRLMLQDFADKYLLYCNLDVTEDIFLGFEELCKHIEVYASTLEKLSECLNCSNDKLVASSFKQIIGNIQKHWTQFNSALLNLQLSKSKPPINIEDIINSFPEIFRSLRSTCDYFLSTFNENFKSHSLHKESESEILKILTNMSLESTSIYKKLMQNSLVLTQVLEIYIFRVKQKFAELESKQCCEIWKQEIQVLNEAHSKEIKELKEQIFSLSEATTPRSNSSCREMRSPFEKKQKNSENHDEAVSEVEDIEVRNEREYIKFFNSRANKLVADRQYAESKVTVLKEECEALQKRLGHSLENRLLLEDSLKQAQNTINKLQEELHTSTSNYELQLQSMSEHLANLNEKLASQEEEIEILRHDLTEKKNKTLFR